MSEYIETFIVKCPRCGVNNRVRKDDPISRVVCGRCKAFLRTEINPIKYPEPSLGHPPNPPVLKKNINIVFIAGIIILLIVSISSLIMFNKKKQATPSNINSRDWRIPNVETKSSAESPLPPSPIRTKPKSNRRLSNGTIIRDDGFSGLGELTIINGLPKDAAAKLIDKSDGLCKAYFYITSENQFTLTGINDGNYRLIFGIGEDWDSATQFFTRNQTFSEFDKPMKFATYNERIGDSIDKKYTLLEVTLHPVLGGNIKTYTISEKEFLKY
jgi:ribosomal protein S27AE